MVVSIVIRYYFLIKTVCNILILNIRYFVVMDESTMSGYSAEYVAQRIVDAVVNDEQEVIIAPFYARLAIGLRYVWPRFYFWIMKCRADRQASQKM